MSEALQVTEVSNGCFHAVRGANTLFVIWPYPGGTPRYGANQLGQEKCVAQADTLREIISRLQPLADAIL